MTAKIRILHTRITATLEVTLEWLLPCMPQFVNRKSMTATALKITPFKVTPEGLLPRVGSLVDLKAATLRTRVTTSLEITLVWLLSGVGPFVHCKMTTLCSRIPAPLEVASVPLHRPDGHVRYPLRCRCFRPVTGRRGALHPRE